MVLHIMSTYTEIQDSTESGHYAIIYVSIQ